MVDMRWEIDGDRLDNAYGALFIENGWLDRVHLGLG